MLDATPEQATEALATSTTFLALYRVIVAVLFAAVALMGASTLGLGEFAPRLFAGACYAYVALAVVFLLALKRVPISLSAQLTVHVLTDIAIIGALSLASGGFRSGVVVMNLVTIAASALIARPRTTFFYAAIATLAILAEQLWWVLRTDLAGGTFVPVGLLALGYFVIAIIVSRLTERVSFNARVARDRGTQLVGQLRINDLVIQDVLDGVLVVGAVGDIRQSNRQALQLLGARDFEGVNISALGAEIAGCYARARAAGIDTEETVVIPATGRRVKLRLQPLEDGGGAGEGFTLIFLEDLSRLEEEAQKVKLVALGRLTANIAHEIRNPLSAITHAADLLGEENRAQGRERLTRIIRDNAYRLDRMVRDVLELNRRDAAQIEAIALEGYVRDFLADFARFEKVPMEAFALEVPADLVVAFDRVHLNQILWNLVRNAWRHGRQTAGSIRVTAALAGGRIELRVADDGPGVPPEHRAKLFEPFFTTFSKGTGLGLYIARELAIANGADLDYLGNEAGAVFCLRAPPGQRESR